MLDIPSLAREDNEEAGRELKPQGLTTKSIPNFHYCFIAFLLRNASDQMGISQEPCAGIRWLSSSAFSTIAAGNLPPFLLLSWVKSDGLYPFYLRTATDGPTWIIAVLLAENVPSWLIRTASRDALDRVR